MATHSPFHTKYKWKYQLSTEINGLTFVGAKKH